jgi:hypothetical protein
MDIYFVRYLSVNRSRHFLLVERYSLSLQLKPAPCLITKYQFEVPMLRSFILPMSMGFVSIIYRKQPHLFIILQRPPFFYRVKKCASQYDIAPP